MKKIILYCICFFAGCSIDVMAQHQLLYLDGKASIKKKDVLVGETYNTSHTLVFEGRRIVFFDENTKTIKYTKTKKIGRLEDSLVIAQEKKFECCLSSFRDFLKYTKIPYLLLYPEEPLTFDKKEPFSNTFGMKLGIGFLVEKENKTYKAVAKYQPNGELMPIYLKKMVDKLIETNAKAGEPNPIESLLFYEYYPDALDGKEYKLITKRTIVITDQSKVKKDVLQCYEMLKDKKNISKEELFVLLLDFVQVVHGRPDAQSFKKWLQEYCGLVF
jgi:hypothetical protein